MAWTDEWQSDAGVYEGRMGTGDEERRERRRERRMRRMRERGIARARPVVRDVLARGLAMSGACLVAVAAASLQHRGSVWAGINAIPSGFGLVGRRPPTHFDRRLSLIGIGSVIGGSILTALVQRPLSRSLGRTRIGTAVLTSVGTWAFDRFVMHRSLLPAMRRALGDGGVFAMYGALGLGSIARRM